MIILATNEVYKIGITGDTEVKRKLNAIETMEKQTEKKMQALNKINVSPTVHLNDQASSKIDALQVRINNIKKSNVVVNVGVKDEANGTLSKIGEKVKGLVKAGAQKIITLGCSGVEASIKNYAEYEQVLSNIKATSKSTDSEMKKLDVTAKKLGSSTKWDATSVVEAEKTLVQSGISVEESVSALPGILNLATAGGIELGAAADIASGTLTGFNLKGSDSAKVADVLASSASETKADLSELGDAMKYMAPVSSSLGISLEDTAVAAGLLSGQNIKGSQAAAMLRQTIGKLASPTKEAADMMKRYNINAYDAEGKMKPLSGVVDNLNSSLGNLPDQEKEGAIATIFGTDNMSGILALMNQGGESFDELSKKVQNAKGSAKEMADIKMNTLAGQWDRLKAAASTMSVSLGEKLAPYAKQFVNWLIEKMPVIEEKILGIVDYVSKNIDVIEILAGSVIGLGVAFAGLSAVGNLANAFTGITSLVGLFKGAGVVAETTAIAGGLGEVAVAGASLAGILVPVGIAMALVGGAIAAVVINNNLMKKSLATTTEELSPIENIMNGLHGHIYKSKSEMQELGLVYEDFGDNIGDDFKSKVEESAKSIREFQMYINKINLDGVISESESADFDSKVNEMCNNSIKTIEDNKAKSQEGMKAMFMDDGTFSDSEKATLEYLSKDSDNKITKEQELRDKIYEIRKKAVARNGVLDETDKEQIKQLQTEMSQIALESAGGNTEELLYAKNKFKARAEGASLEDGSSLAQEAAKDRDDRIVDVKATYDTNLEKLRAQLADPNYTGDKEKLSKTIIENEQAKAAKIAEVNKLYDDQLKLLYQFNKNLDGQINKHDGTILSGGDKESQSSLEKMKDNYTGLKDIKESGMYSLENTGTGKFENVYVTYNKVFDDVEAAYAEATQEVNGHTTITRTMGGYTSKMAEDAQATNQTMSWDSINLRRLESTSSASVNPSGDMIDNSGKVIAKLGEIQAETDGTLYRILNLNGTPIHILTDSDGTVKDIDGIKQEVEKVPFAKTIEASANLDPATSQIDTFINTPNGKEFTIIGNFIPNFGWTFPNNPNTSTGENSSNSESATGSESDNDLIKSSIMYTGSNDTEKTVKPDIRKILNPNFPLKLNYNGTTNGTRGINSVAERGFEIVMGRQLRWFNGGEKVLTHEQSKAFLQNQQTNEPFQVKQGQYQVFQPQMQGAGAGNVSVGDIQVSVNGNQDANGIVQEVVQVVGYKLKEALTNIKK